MTTTISKAECARLNCTHGKRTLLLRAELPKSFAAYPFVAHECHSVEGSEVYRRRLQQTFNETDSAIAFSKILKLIAGAM